MDITYLGHSSFRLRGKAASVVTDPFDPGKVGIKFPKVSADIVTVSHDHFDHNNVGAINDVKRVVDGPGEYEISDVSIIGVPTFHDDKKGNERGKNTVYILEIDQLRIVHLGDLGHKLSEDMLEEIGNVDILMLPVGGVYTIGPSEAAEVARSIEASITIPMHYLQKGMNKESFGKLSGVEDFLKDISMTVEKTDKLKIKKSDLGEDQKVVVIEKK